MLASTSADFEEVAEQPARIPIANTVNTVKSALNTFISFLLWNISTDQRSSDRMADGRLADQFLEKRPVMNHCLAQLFRSGLSGHLAKCDFMGCPVVFEDQWMIHGDIGRPLFKVGNRIASCGHHIAQQPVRLTDRTGGAVYETRLQSAPGL